MKLQQVNKEQVFYTLDHIYKQGYSSISSMPKWIENEYRNLPVAKIINFVNDWIDDRKINHKHLTLKENN